MQWVNEQVFCKMHKNVQAIKNKPEQIHRFDSYANDYLTASYNIL